MNSQFAYCSLVRINIVKKSKIHKRTRTLVCNNTNVTFKELITNDKSATLRDRGLQVLVTEKFKV